MATTAAAMMLGGLGLTIHGVSRDQASHSLAGFVLSMIALAVIILTVLHSWITDTRTERIALAAAQREAQAERTRCIAAQAALENEQGRLYRDLAAERAADRERLEKERAAMHEQFELDRGQLVNEAMATLASWIVDGKVQPPERKTNLIRFPNQEQQTVRTPQRETPRGHGAAGSGTPAHPQTTA
ncbi:hypothetical protein [Streptomyces sp. NPDC088812]|uniref:hypothetical protein n=1 Tax=Streptomyces sp. NPDC088812 TaxID=3365905 RepID=UPI00380F5603